MKEVYVIKIEWNMKGDNGHEILCVTDTESMIPNFKSLLDNEKQMSWLKDYFNEDGTLNKEKIGIDEPYYEEREDYFEFSLNNYEWYTIMSVQKFDVISYSKN